MKIKVREGYILILSNCPCEVFKLFNVEQMHGLNLKDCLKHENTEKSAYIAGLCNFIPKENDQYTNNDERFIFINLKRFRNNDIEGFGLVMHECMHQAFFKYGYDMEQEEELITWAENEAYEIYKFIKNDN